MLSRINIEGMSVTDEEAEFGVIFCIIKVQYVDDSILT